MISQIADTMAQVASIIDLLFDHVESVYQGKAWHGPALRGSLRGLTAHAASHALAPSGHSIADIALHCAYWKYSVRRRLQNTKRGSFAWKGSNWFKLPVPLSEAMWKNILTMLDEEHEALCDAIRALPEQQLNKVPKGSRYNYSQLIQGIAAHDVFHAGQVRLLKPKTSD